MGLTLLDSIKILLIIVTYVEGSWLAKNGIPAKNCQLQERVLFENTNEESCAIRCSENPKCVAMIFKADKGQCILHASMIGVEHNIPQLLKRCFHSNVEGMKLFHGPMDSPVDFEELEKRAFEANFTKTVVRNNIKKYYKLFTYQEVLPYWQMERICLSHQGTLPSDLTSTNEAKQILDELLPGALVLPVGMRKFSTNLNTKVVYRWTNGFEGYRDLPGAATCNPNATQSGKSPIYLDDTGDTRANAGFYSSVKDSFMLDYDTNGQKTFACEFVGSTNLAAGRKITSGGATKENGWRCGPDPYTPSGCCTPQSPCSEGEGDCDTDDQCASDLKCGKDNCKQYWPGFQEPSDHQADCCFHPVTPGSQTPMASFVTDPYWGENEGEGEELPGGGWQLPTGVTFKWVAVHLGKPYYVQRVVYMLAKRCCGHKIIGVRVYVGDEPGANIEKNKLCGEDIVTKEEKSFSVRGIRGVGCNCLPYGSVVTLRVNWNTPQQREKVTIARIGVFGLPKKVSRDTANGPIVADEPKSPSTSSTPANEIPTEIVTVDVTCTIAADNKVTWAKFVLGGDNKLSLAIQKIDDNWNTPKTVNFQHQETIGSLEIRAVDFTQLGGTCNQSGIVVYCNASDPSSPWNHFKSDPATWKSINGDVLCSDEYSNMIATVRNTPTDETKWINEMLDNGAKHLWNSRGAIQKVTFVGSP